MYTIDRFTSEWKHLHHPSMNVDGDAAFYYEVYGRLHRLVEPDTHKSNEETILSLLLYTENIIAVGLDGVYEYMYRSLGDVVFHWCDGLGMNANTTSKVHNLVSEAVAKATQSSLRQWMTECVLAGDFMRLSDMLVYFVREDRNLRRVFPDLRYRQAVFLKLTGNSQTAGQMMWADMAFNWRDKHGKSLSATIAKQFRLSASTVEGQESGLLSDVANALDTIRPERLDTYTVMERKDERTLTLRHRDGCVFGDVTFPDHVSENAQGRHLAAQLVTYRDKTYINGSAVWLNKEALPVWNGENVWNDIQKKEQEAAKHTCFTTPFGKRISLYEDLYTVPLDPEEAYYADMGIYLDEPNIFDFLEWLKPSGTVSGTAKL